MYDLGIIGGMGPEATSEMFRRIVLLTDAKCDQEHMSICILNKSQIPDRTQYIINKGESPLPMILHGIDELKTLGCRYFIIPCNTSHIFSKDFEGIEGIRFINMIEATRKHLKKNYKGHRVCVLGTRGTASAKTYGEENSNSDIDLFYPDQSSQSELMRIITSIKANKVAIEKNRKSLIKLMKEIIKSQGSCVFVIACTELSIAIYASELGKIQYIDSMEILAIQSIKDCGYKLK